MPDRSFDDYTAAEREALFQSAVQAIAGGNPSDPDVLEYERITAHLPKAPEAWPSGAATGLTLIMAGAGMKGVFPVESLADASRLYSERVGGRGASQSSDGLVFNGDTLVARISYNGRAWAPDAGRHDAPLFDPGGTYWNPFADARTRIDVRFALDGLTALARLAGPAVLA